MDIQLGYWRWKIRRWNEHPNPFRGRSDLALAWLRGFRNDRLVMAELRDLLTGTGTGGLRWSNDTRVLEEVAARLSTGEFQVCPESGHPFHTAVADVNPADPQAAADEEALKAQPARPAPPPPAPKPEPAPESTLPPEADAAQIANVLQQASQSGTPFCEECAKAALAQASAASSPPATPAAAQN